MVITLLGCADINMYNVRDFMYFIPDVCHNGNVMYASNEEKAVLFNRIRVMCFDREGTSL